MGNKFQYISYAVIGILFFIGIKMLISMFGVHLESLVSLAVIIGALAMGIGASVMWKNRKG
jgi:tellurite resistance protein TerC